MPTPAPAIRASTALLVLGTVLVGCGPGSDARASAWDRLTGGAPDDDAPRLEAREVLKLGGLEAPEPYLFSTLADVVRAPDGTYYVADDVAVTTRVFDAEGGFLREIGRKGEGPGELMRVHDLVLGPGVVAMVDRGRGGRVALHGTDDGEPIDDWRHTRDDASLLPLAPDGDGWLVERVPLTNRPRTLPHGERWQSFRTLHRMGDPADSLGPEIARWVDRTWYGNSSLIGPDVLEPLFRHPVTFVTDGAGRFYRSEGWPYRIEVLDASGRVMRVVERDVEPVPVGERDVREFRDRVMVVFDTLSEIPDAARLLLKPLLSGEIERMGEVPHAEVRTAVGNVVAARDGSIWVERWDHESPARREVGRLLDLDVDTPNRWDLFDPSGALVGQVVLPPRFRATHATASTLTGVLKGEFDLEFVVTYEIEPVGEPGG